MANYKIFTTLTGKKRIKHKCPKCAGLIENEFAEAGQPDSCPVCGQSFIVPGAVELKQHEENLRKEAAARERQKVEAAQEQQRAEAARLEGVKFQAKAEQSRLAVNERAKLPADRHGKWVYRVVQFEYRTSIVEQLAHLMNMEARAGWEFQSMEVFQTLEPPGCLAALFGSNGVVVNRHLAIFRRPFDRVE
jgi:DNA-directed RNA polymerase subunit M/transcription elongation factor TFIIS